MTEYTLHYIISIVSSWNRNGKCGACKLLNLFQLYQDTIITLDFISDFSSPGVGSGRGGAGESLFITVVKFNVICMFCLSLYVLCMFRGP